MKKYVTDLTVTEVWRPTTTIVRLTCRPENLECLACATPGQFAQLSTRGAFLRRPISIHYADPERGEIRFLIQTVGEGTRWFATLQPGDRVNAVLPLGRGFSEDGVGERPLLVGGGIGIAPLLFLGKRLSERGIRPTFLLGARSRSGLILLDEFRQYGDVLVTTEDGSEGERGFVTGHSRLADGECSMSNGRFSMIQTCGPTPMMRAVARYAREHDIPCEVSLENRMACGVGACLCCVQQTVEGHKCVCTEGPVFNSQFIIHNS